VATICKQDSKLKKRAGGDHHHRRAQTSHMLSLVTSMDIIRIEKEAESAHSHTTISR
jgi:hypothetical protein